MAKLNSSEEQILKEISEWKAKGPGFLNKATHLMSKPLVWTADKFIPEDAKKQMSKLTEIIVDKLQDVSQWSVNESEVLKATREFEIDSETILELKKASIHDLDHVSEVFMKRNQRIAMAEGFGSGLIGWPGLIADMPILFMLAYRNIYQVSLCYGYGFGDPSDETLQRDFEMEYMLRLFKIATASSKVEKMEGLMELKNFEIRHEDEMQRELGSDYTVKQMSKNAVINVSRVLINEIIQQILARKAVTSIPGIGAVLTAGFNYAYIEDVGRTAFNLYRERFLLDKKGRKKVINIDID